MIKLHTPLHMADQQTGAPAVSIHSQQGPQLDTHILLPHPIQAAESDTFEEQIEVRVIAVVPFQVHRMAPGFQIFLDDRKLPSRVVFSEK